MHRKIASLPTFQDPSINKSADSNLDDTSTTLLPMTTDYSDSPSTEVYLESDNDSPSTEVNLESDNHSPSTEYYLESDNNSSNTEKVHEISSDNDSIDDGPLTYCDDHEPQPDVRLSTLLSNPAEKEKEMDEDSKELKAVADILLSKCCVNKCLLHLTVYTILATRRIICYLHGPE